MPSVTTDDGVAISYATAGEGPATLLCMHGWAGSGRYFDAMSRQVDLSQLRVVTYDLRGHRDSAPATDDHTLKRIADDALAVADAAGARQFVVLGFSMSAKFCQYLALAAPDRVLGQILVAGCPAGELPLPQELVDDWLGREGDPTRMTQLSEAYMTRQVGPELLERFGRDAATVSLAALKGTLSTVIATSFTDRLASLTTPSLVVGGSGDPMFGPELLRTAVVAPLAGASLELVDCGHEIPIEAPRELATLIEGFLTRLG